MPRVQEHAYSQTAMQRFIRSLLTGLLLATSFGVAVHNAEAAEVRVGVSTRDAYVGMPVIVQLQVSNAASVEPPVIPEVDGLKIQARGNPAQSTQITTINGRTAKSTSLTYLFEVTPQRAGTFQIPAIAVDADGVRQQTRPIEIVASKSETNDLMFVEVAGKESAIYVGQALDLTLKIWIRPYRDAKHGLTLSASDMWQMISPRSNWGCFEEPLRQLEANRERPRASEVLRKDSEGVAHSYYLYEIDATIYPKSPGKIDANDVRLIVEYPTALGRARDPFASLFDDMSMPGFGGFGRDPFPSPFSRRLAVESVRPIVADAAVEPIEVRAIPTANRPADYRGAVGRYQIITEASPATVKAGDPIELLIGVVGAGPMELVQAPPLAELADLTADFKVPHEPLAGFVQGDRKVFATTIRPRKEGVAQIPAIPLTYFDPEQGQFVTVKSQPISIHVDPADTLALDAIVGARAAANNRSANRSNQPSELTPALEIYQGNSLLTNETPRRLNAAMLAFLAIAPPLTVGVLWSLRNRRVARGLMGRLGAATKRLRVRIEQAESASEVSELLQTFLARRFRINAKAPDEAAICGALRTAGFHKLAVQAERVFQAGKPSSPWGVSHHALLDESKRLALEVMSQLRHGARKLQVRPRRSHQRYSPIKRPRNAATRVAGLLLFAAFMTACSGAAASPASLPNAREARQLGSDHVVLESTQQRESILSEAEQLYGRAMKALSEDSATANEAFTAAAAKYQLLVDAGVKNSRLYVNLANAYLQSGQRGRAIANYERALAIDASNPIALRNRQFLAASLPVDSAPGDLSQEPDFAAVATAAKTWAIAHVPARVMGVTAVVAWFALWAVVGMRLDGFRFPWRTATALCAVVALGAAATYAANFDQTDQCRAVVTQPHAELRAGDGSAFPLTGAALSEGTVVEVVRRRGEWVKIAKESGETGWLAGESVEII